MIRDHTHNADRRERIYNRAVLVDQPQSDGFVRAAGTFAPGPQRCIGHKGGLSPVHPVSFQALAMTRNERGGAE